MSNLSYSIVCCFFNEKKLLKEKFDELISKSKKFSFIHEILICDNNSNDGTTELLKEYEKQKIINFKFIFNDKNLGKIVYCDIFFSIDTIESFIKKNKINFYDHLNHLIIHSLLHINGYDHKNNKQYNIMKREEIKILKNIGIKDPYKNV